MIPVIPIAEGAGGEGGSVGGQAGLLRFRPRPPSLTLLHRPVDSHGATGKVLQLLDARLATQVGRSCQRSVDVATSGGYPGMGQQLLGRQPLGTVLGQELADEGLGKAGDVLPVLLGEHDLALADVLEQHLLAVRAVVSILPSAVVATVTREGSISTEKDVHNNTQGPHITFLVVNNQIFIII